MTASEAHALSKYPLTAIVHKEGDQWVALCLELDISSYGNTEEEAFASLDDLIHQYVNYMRSLGKPWDEMKRPVPVEAIREFLVGDPESSEIYHRNQIVEETFTARLVHA